MPWKISREKRQYGDIFIDSPGLRYVERDPIEKYDVTRMILVGDDFVLFNKIEEHKLIEIAECLNKNNIVI